MRLSKFTDQELISLLGSFIENQKDLYAPYKAEVLRQTKERLEQLIKYEKRTTKTALCCNTRGQEEAQTQSPKDTQ